MTAFQQLKNGKYALVSAWDDSTRRTLPTLFWYSDGKIRGLNTEVGQLSGWINGREYNLHVREMVRSGFAVTTWGDAETAREMFHRADDDARAAQRGLVW